VEDVRAFLTREHVEVDGIYQVPRSFGIIRGTPTLLIVDTKGVVRRASEGMLNAFRQEEILRIVQGGSL
jgi:hypothetical protein